MSPRLATILGATLVIAACGEGQYFDEIEARACPEATLLPREVPASNAVVLSLGAYDCALGALEVVVEARGVAPGATMAYVEVVDLPELLILRDAIGGPFPSRGTVPFFSTVRQVEDSPEDYLLVNGSLVPTPETSGVVLTLDFDLVRTPFRDEVVELRVDPATSAIFGADFQPRPGVAFVGARIRFR